MEMKRWNLIFSGLCLALVFSVSSVEAQHCGMCQKCDQDGDLEIRASTFCAKKCGSATDTADNEDLGNCPVDGDGGDDATYSLEFLDPITGDNGTDPWTEHSTNNIGFAVHHNTATTNVDLSFFAHMGNNDGDPCFDGGADFLDGHTFRVSQMQAFKGRGGRPEVWFWIHAQTVNDD